MAYRAFAKRAVSLGVSYVEFTTGVTTDSLPSLVRVLTKIEADFGLKIRLNRAFHRTQTPSALQAEMPDLFKIQDNPWVVGIDLLGNETQTPALETGQDVYGAVLLALERGKTQLHRTMHAGELGDPRNPRDAMILGAERLGHGVKLMEDPVALEYAARHRIGVEINLSSNLRLSVIDRLEKHPFLDYLRLGIPVSLSTDDEGIFEIDIQHECEEVISHTDVTYFELKEMIFNSIESSFASIEDKRNVLGQLESDFSSFEKDLQTQTVLQ
jgi:adenosine deaminase